MAEKLEVLRHYKGIARLCRGEQANQGPNRLGACNLFAA